MALRSEDLPTRLQSLSGLLTSHEAAHYLQMTYWHFMHLVEGERIAGLRVVDRWLFSPEDLEAYRRERYGELEDTARAALNNADITLTDKQATICRDILAGHKPSDIARQLRQSRQAVHAQLGLVREKVVQAEAAKPNDSKRSPLSSSSTSSNSSHSAPLSSRRR
jgi:DNA-binding CsgD family transcriptional regulator